MKNRRIEIKLGRTVNLGNYESERVDLGLSADIGDKVPLNDAYQKLHQEVRKHLIVYVESIKQEKQGSRRPRR